MLTKNNAYIYKQKKLFICIEIHRLKSLAYAKFTAELFFLAEKTKVKAQKQDNFSSLNGQISKEVSIFVVMTLPEAVKRLNKSYKFTDKHYLLNISKMRHLSSSNNFLFFHFGFVIVCEYPQAKRCNQFNKNLMMLLSFNTTTRITELM